MTLKLILNNIKSNKIKYIITVISVSISIGSIILITTVIYTGQSIIFQNIESSGLDSLLINSVDGNLFNETDIELLKEEIKNIKSISPAYMKMTKANIKNEIKDIFLWGVGEETEDLVGTKTLYGRGITKEDILNNQKVCIIDKEISKSMYGRENIVGKTIKINIQGFLTEFKVVGVIDASQNIINMVMKGYIEPFVYTPFSTMIELSSSNGFDRIALNLIQDNDKEFTTKQIKKTMNNKLKKDVQIESVFDGLDIIDSIIDIITIILTVIASISMFISGLMIMMVMINSVNERVIEIGVKKSLGARNIEILKEFILESVIISVIGFLISIVSVYSVLIPVFLYFNIPIFINVESIIFIFVFSIVVGVAFGAYPAHKASNLNPCEAFRK